MRRTRTVALVTLALASLTLTAGCGGSGPSPVTLVSPGVPLPTTSTSSAGSTPANATASMSQSPDATVDFAFSTGDHVELTFRIDQPTDMAAADLMAQSCRLDNDDSHALVQHVFLSTKLTSSLTQKFTLKFGRPLLVPLAIQLASGGQCLYPDPDSQLPLTLVPGQSLPIDMWLIGDGAKTPANPAGDPKVLRQMTFNPSMHVGWTDMVQPDAVISTAFGSRVLVCNLDTVHTIHAEVFTTATAFAKGDTYCAPAATRADFAALEAQAGTVQDGGTASP